MLLSLLCLIAGVIAGPVNAQTNGQIAFQTFRDGNWEIYLMGPEGQNPVNLTQTSTWEMRPSFSPDGQRSAFESNRSGQFELYAVDLDGENLVQLTDSPGNGHAVFSPDGQQIAFESNRGGTWEIFRMDADGQNPVQLTTEPSNGQPS